MAYQQDFNNEDEPNKTPNQVISSDNTSQVSAPGAGASTSNPAQQKQGTGFTNLSTYVNANQDQSGDMANNVVSGLRSGLDSANSGLNSLSTSVNNDIQKNTVNDNGFIDSLKSSSNLSSPDIKSQYDKQTIGYKGPNSLNDYQPYQDLSQKFSGLDQQEKSLNDTNSIRNTLKSNYNRPDYTTGQNTLDAFLTTSGKGADTLNNFKQGYEAQNPSRNFQNVSTDLNNRLANARKTTNDTANATTIAYNTALANQQAMSKLEPVAQTVTTPAPKEKPAVQNPNQDVTNNPFGQMTDQNALMRSALAPTHAPTKTIVPKSGLQKGLETTATLISPTNAAAASVGKSLKKKIIG